MKTMKLGVVWVLIGMGLAMLLSVVLLVSEESVSAQVATDPVLVGAGDIATAAPADTKTAELIKGMPDATVFTAGDNAYPNGTTSDYNTKYDPTWGQFKNRTKPTPGNHDYYATANASGYFGYFGTAAGDPSKGYYSYNLGDWHVVALNSMCEQVGGCDATSPMVRWLEQDLAATASSAACTLAYFHHPLFSSGQHGNQIKMKPTWEALYAANAEVVVSGHDHDYERFAPQTPDGTLDTNQGIREFVVGTGGANLRPMGFPQPNSEEFNSDTHGVIRFTLHQSSYDWEFLPVAGQNFTDSGSGNCHGGTGGEDTEAPTVTGTVPNTNATRVDPLTPVTATFSEDMNGDTIDTTTFRLFKNGSTTRLTAAVQYDPSTNTATLDPSANLERGVKYKAVVTTRARDLAGNRLDGDATRSGSQNKRWFFTVRN